MKHVYKIEGMHCEACIQKIKTALQSLTAQMDVSLDPPRLTINLDEPLSLETLNAMVAKAGNYHLTEQLEDVQKSTGGWLSTYYPLILIIAYIVAVSFIANMSGAGFSWYGWMNHFMAGFFLVFSAFKFLDLKGFATAYATYDVLAARWYGYGYLYPFLELALGLAYLSEHVHSAVLVFTVVLMGFSSIGVLQALLAKRKIQCACLGTILKLPMSGITLVEDLLMMFMALIMLVVH